jgi:hypothetical protein
MGPGKGWRFFVWAIRVQTAGEAIWAVVAALSSAYVTAIIAGAFAFANTILLWWLNRVQRRREWEWEKEWEQRRLEWERERDQPQRPKPPQRKTRPRK